MIESLRKTKNNERNVFSDEYVDSYPQKYGKKDSRSEF